MSWTQPVCSADWFKRNPNRGEPHRIVPEYAEEETCCYCGQLTTSGIYVRVDPATVPHPSND